MLEDRFGQTITLRDAQARDEWDRAVMAFLAHGAATPTHLGQALERAPDFALGHAVKGLFLVLLGRRELYPIASEALETAHAAARATSITPREELFLKALEACLVPDFRRTLAHLGEAMRLAPADPLAAKLDHSFRFVLGDAAGMRRSLEAALPAFGEGHAARGYMLGCHAFALEETGDYAAAHVRGSEGLALCADDAWGLHAISHIYDMTGDAQGGLDWLDGREAAWAHCNNFRYHVWWHKALMYLDIGDHAAVLALYDSEIRADRTDDYRDIANATSLLMRLELDGADVGDRWEELARFSMDRTEDGCLVFADLHYLLALAGGRRPDAATKLIGRIRRDAEVGPNGAPSDRNATPGLPAALGLEAFGEGRYAQAFGHLTRARADMPSAGGSHAQRDVFERVTIDAGIRAGQMDAAEALLMDRTARRGAPDGYAEARHALIADARRVPAE